MGREAGLKKLWLLCTKIGTRRIGKAVKKVAKPYRDTLFFYNVEECAGVDGYVALTIDDGLCRMGADRSLVPEVRELLCQHDTRATFFICSHYVKGGDYPAAAEMYLEGHEFANHMTEDRGDFNRMPAIEFEIALQQCSLAIQSLPVGTDTSPADASARLPRWFRAPQGKLTSSMRQAVIRNGMRHVIGDCYCDDWGIEDPEFIAKTMLRQVQSGSILIMHMPERGFREHCFEAIKLVLEGLAERGLKAVTLSSLEARAKGTPHPEPPVQVTSDAYGAHAARQPGEPAQATDGTAPHVEPISQAAFGEKEPGPHLGPPSRDANGTRSRVPRPAWHRVQALEPVDEGMPSRPSLPWEFATVEKKAMPSSVITSSGKSSPTKISL